MHAEDESCEARGGHKGYGITTYILPVGVFSRGIPTVPHRSRAPLIIMFVVRHFGGMAPGNGVAVGLEVVRSCSMPSSKVAATRVHADGRWCLLACALTDIPVDQCLTTGFDNAEFGFGVVGGEGGFWLKFGDRLDNLEWQLHSTRCLG